MRSDLPSGTVTFLFTDIEGSTKVLHELGAEAYSNALAEHRRLLREAIARHEGVEVDTQGDAFFFAFPTAPGALQAAEEGRAALMSGPIRVRMGLHTGRPHVSDEGYVGADVHLGARIAAAGHGGQVLLSGPTKELTDLPVLDLGEHRLKDFAEPVWIYQLGTERFPPLKTISNTNLPRPASSFVGREREVSEVVALLQDSARLVTLSGPGGSGKTRLAIASATELVPEYRNGVFWVGLAPVRDAALVTETIAQTVGAKNGLAEHIADRELLLLLDNFEQVVESAPELSGLLSACPNLRLIVTSRELLRVQGEVEYPVPTLASPEAVELFCQRSRLEPSEEIAELCARLDNLPLAVELAAARTSVLTPGQILGRLSQRLDLLKGGRDAEARQQTLRATIEWSYELLSEGDKLLFARLSVFAGGCALEAAEGVAEADLDNLQSLVDKSLLRHTDERFWMLETIREYAGERLEVSGEDQELGRRHAEFFLELAKSAHLTFEWVDHNTELASADVDNLRAAMTWARSAHDPELALRIATALEMLWIYTNPSEGLRWYSELLEEAGDVPVELRGHALLANASVANPAGDDALAERLYEESLRAFEEIGDRRHVAHLLMRLGHAALYRGDLGRAKELGVESLEMCTDPHTETLALGLVGETEFRLGYEAHGMELIAQSAELAGETGFSWQRTRMLRRLADWELDHGNVADAERLLGESLQLSHELGDRISVVFALARLARVATETGQPERAGRLWGAVEAEEEGGALGAWYGERERFAVHVLAQVGPEFERGREEGRRLSLDEAVEEALRPGPGS
jgi:predicted ATPase